MNEYRVVIDLVNCETRNYIGEHCVQFGASTDEQIVECVEDIVDKNRDCDFGGYCVEKHIAGDVWETVNYGRIFNKVNTIKSSNEIADRLYELSKDLDFEDYEDSKEQDIKALENAIYNLKLYANSSNDFDVLYNALQNI